MFRTSESPNDLRKLFDKSISNGLFNFKSTAFKSSDYEIQFPDKFIDLKFILL